MTDQLLNIFKYALLALLYLFFARVLWAVWSEVRGPRTGRRPEGAQAMARAAVPAAGGDTTGVIGVGAPVPSPVAAPPSQPGGKAPRGRRGTVARLVISQPRVRRGAGFALNQEISIGRAPTCAITIPDDTFVSQLHARAFVLDGAAWVEDLGSTNGSYLNGKRLNAPTRLNKGDRLQIGNTIFEAE